MHELLFISNLHFYYGHALYNRRSQRAEDHLRFLVRFSSKYYRVSSFARHRSSIYEIDKTTSIKLVVLFICFISFINIKH